MGDIGLGPSNRALLIPLGQLQPIVQLLFKIAITHLLEDVGVPRLVDLEGFVAVGQMNSCMWDGTLRVGWASFGPACCRRYRKRNAAFF
jgi:hypothetical protein